MSLLNKLLIGGFSLVPEKIARPLVWPIAKNYIAGNTYADAFCITRQLNKKGIRTEIAPLGEEIKNIDELDSVAEEHLEVIRGINENNLNAGIAVKPTHFGLFLEKKQCWNNIHHLAEQAARKKVSLCLDMEDHRVTSDTIEMYFKLKNEFGPIIKIAIQSYLWRTVNDIKLFGPTDNVRLCKGIYNEPPHIAIKEDPAIDRNYDRCLKYLLERNCFLDIATQDTERIIEAMHLIALLGAAEHSEFQMLLGVREWLHDIILDAGYNLCVYVPFGPKWYPYCVRRFRENPKIVTYVAKQFLKIKK